MSGKEFRSSEIMFYDADGNRSDKTLCCKADIVKDDKSTVMKCEKCGKVIWFR